MQTLEAASMIISYFIFRYFIFSSLGSPIPPHVISKIPRGKFVQRSKYAISKELYFIVVGEGKIYRTYIIVRPNFIADMNNARRIAWMMFDITLVPMLAGGLKNSKR